jgi:hypothetical protein
LVLVGSSQFGSWYAACTKPVCMVLGLTTGGMPMSSVGLVTGGMHVSSVGLTTGVMPTSSVGFGYM